MLTPVAAQPWLVPLPKPFPCGLKSSGRISYSSSLQQELSRMEVN